jgi:hypothetical protein
MNALANTTYDQALYGEPLWVALGRRLLNTQKRIWTVGEWEIGLPPMAPRRAPETQRAVADLKTWTSWSSRQLAGLLSTSHTTIGRLEAGGELVAGHSGELRQRLLTTHDVVGRVATIANYDPAVIKDALEYEHQPGASAMDALRNGEPSVALLRALDRVRPRPVGLITGSGSRRSGATAALHE